MFQINNVLASVKSIDLLPNSVEEWDFTYVEDEDGGFSFVNGKWKQTFTSCNCHIMI